MEEVALQRWEGDRIAEERFFYDPRQTRPAAASLIEGGFEARSSHAPVSSPCVLRRTILSSFPPDACARGRHSANFQLRANPSHHLHGKSPDDRRGLSCPRRRAEAFEDRGAAGRDRRDRRSARAWRSLRERRVPRRQGPPGLDRRPDRRDRGQDGARPGDRRLQAVGQAGEVRRHRHAWSTRTPRKRPATRSSASTRPT